MSPKDAGRVTDTAASPAQMATSLTKLARPVMPAIPAMPAMPAIPLPDEDGRSRLQERPPRKADIRLFNDPSNFLG